MTTPTPLQAMLGEFRKIPTSYTLHHCEMGDLEGMRKPYFQKYQLAVESFLTSEFTALLEGIEKEVEAEKKSYPRMLHIGNVSAVFKDTVYNSALDTALAIIRKYKI